MDAPESIFVEVKGTTIRFNISVFDGCVDSHIAYTRADLVDRLVAEAVAKERERCAEIVRREQSDMTRKHYDRFSVALAAIREGGE